MMLRLSHYFTTEILCVISLVGNAIPIVSLFSLTSPFAIYHLLGRPHALAVFTVLLVNCDQFSLAIKIFNVPEKVFRGLRDLKAGSNASSPHMHIALDLCRHLV